MTGARVSVHQDKVFFKVFIGVLAGLALFTFAIAILANMFSPDGEGARDPLVQMQLEERLMPVGKSRIAQ